MLLRQSTRERPNRSNFQSGRQSNFLAQVSVIRRFSAGRLAFAPLITSWYISTMSQPWWAACSVRSRDYSSAFWSAVLTLV